MLTAAKPKSAFIGASGLLQVTLHALNGRKFFEQCIGDSPRGTLNELVLLRGEHPARAFIICA